MDDEYARLHVGMTACRDARGDAMDGKHPPVLVGGVDVAKGDNHDGANRESR